MTWLSLLDNPQVVEHLYNSPPDLSNVTIHEITLSCSGVDVEIRFNLKEFPDRPPRKWDGTEDRVQITLHLFVVEQVEIKKWSTTENPVGISMDRCQGNDGINFVASTSDGILFSCICSIIRVVGFSGYTYGGPERGLVTGESNRTD